jgi:hypothetical protein
VISERAGTLLGALVLFGAATLRPPHSAPHVRADSCWRTAAADYAWLRARLAWERREEAWVRNWLGVALAAAPGHVYFRINAARTIAYDFPAWRAGTELDAPLAVQAAWRAAAADEAIAALLDQRSSAPRPDLLAEAATIALYAKGDRALAAELFRRAAETGTGAGYAARIHARLLCEGGERDKAVRWLEDWLATSASAMADDDRRLTVQLLAQLSKTPAPLLDTPPPTAE